MKLSKMQTVFRTDPSEFCVRSTMILMNCDCAKAKDLAGVLSEADIEAAIAEKEFWEQKVSTVLAR